MARDKYRIKSPTIALFLEDGRHVAHKVPAGAVIMVESTTFDGDKLIGVLWADTSVMMFTQDIRARGEKLD